MIDVGRFFIAVCVSPVMNSLPSTLIFFTSFPLMVILPSSETSAPGSLFTSSSTTEPSGVRKALALYTKVSSFITTFLACPVAVTPCSIMASVFSFSVPSATFFPWEMVTACVSRAYPTLETFTMYLPSSGASNVNSPFSSVSAPEMKVLSLRSSCTVLCMTASFESLSTTFPVIFLSCACAIVAMHATRATIKSLLNIIK